MAESGYPGFEALAWHGILAPAKTPPEIVKKLNEEIVKALADPATKKLLEDQAMQTVGSTPADFAAFIAEGHCALEGRSPLRSERHCGVASFARVDTSPLSSSDHTASISGWMLCLALQLCASSRSLLLDLASP